MRASIPALLLAIAVAALGCGEEGARPAASLESSRLFLAGDGELWVVDTGSGTSRRFDVPELVGGDPPHRIASRGDRLVLWGYDTWSLDPDQPAKRPDRIARDSWIWIPSIHPDRVWVGYLDAEQRRSRGLRFVREIDASGAITRPDVPPPDGAWPEASIDAGLIFPHPTDPVLLLWDPLSREVIRRMPRDSIGSLGPAHGNQLASCVDSCRTLVLTDFATDRQRSIPAPGGHTFEIWNGMFSMDGATIATTVRERGPGPDASKLTLVSVASGKVRVIDGSGVPPGYTFVLWDGADALVASGEFSGCARLIRYSPSSDEVTRISLDVGRFYDAAIG